MKNHGLVIILLLLFALTTEARGFLNTKQITLREERFKAEIDFPTGGNPDVIAQVKLWICDVLDTDAPSRLRENDFRDLLLRCCGAFEESYEKGSRKVEVVRSYEDANVVTFESKVTDNDSTVWITEDCACFSKHDGHRLTAGEIFDCNESQIKQLMWHYRGDIPTGMDGPKGLVVGNAGFIDGWIIVIGPAENSAGRAYRVRYQAAEPYLKKSKDGEYY